ncbi:MAG TPA: DUF2848 domain-containing protein [Planctomycetota bacterium]|nr:DUF2848 domain-containing protein [Planctomycetota bacterium]
MSAGLALRRAPARVRDLVIAGWTGRDAAAVERHIAELQALGVPRPASVPVYYRAGSVLLTTDEEIDVAGPDTSGEVECVLFALEDGLWVGAGSDHTDRRLETFDVALSKQVCPKPVAPDLWRFDEVADHWDRLVLRSFAGGALYQEGSVAALRRPDDLVRARFGGPMPAGTALFCGTVPARGGVRGAERFEFELHDPVLGRTIRHGYSVRVLPLP